MPQKTMLVAGASGLVGRAALRRFSQQNGWNAIGASRRIPEGISGPRLIALDFADAQSCAAAIAEIGADVTHLIFCAQYEAPGLAAGWFDPEAIALNDRMLRNVVDPLCARAKNLQHISLMQGSKAYGMHHPELQTQLRIPLKERDPRLEHPNFYFLQEDYLRTLQAAGAPWGMTVLRPTIIYGDAANVNMSCIRAIAVYAALEREKGNVLDYPGGSYDQPFREGADCDLVAEALDWATAAPKAQNATFNLTNGDTFTWRYAWSAVSETFGMIPGGHRPMSFAEDLPKRDAEWAALVDRYKLNASKSIVEYVGANSLLYADWMLGAIEGVAAPMNSTIAIRQAGFSACMDSEDMFRKWFGIVQDTGVVSPRRAAQERAI